MMTNQKLAKDVLNPPITNLKEEEKYHYAMMKLGQLI